MKLRCLSLGCVWLSLFAPVASAAIVCVRPGGGGGCHATIVAGLAAANPGDVIRVASGSYPANLLINESVTLEGGWNSTFTLRDPALQVTTIQPTANASVVSIFGTFGAPEQVRPVLDGFTITGGTADAGSNHGGGVSVRNSNATLRDCVITANRAYLLGGGVWLQHSPSVLFERVRITANVVDTQGSLGLGGGVNAENSGASFVDSSIEGNSIDGLGGQGGGIFAGGPYAVSLRGGTLSANSAGTSCQGYGGGIFAANAASLRLDGVKVESNCGTFEGGGFAVSMTPFSVSHSLFRNNDGGGNGNGFHGEDAASTGSVVNTTIAGTGTGRGIVVNAMLTLTASIVTGFATGLQADPGQPVTATANDFFANTTNATGATLGATNLFVDPLLDATGHLEVGSPMIDAAPAIYSGFRDFDGQPRPQAGPSGRFRVDIGGDEWPGELQVVGDADSGHADYAVRGPGNPVENAASTGSSDWIGYSVLGGDLTGDGFDDLVVAAEDLSNDFDVNAMAATGRLFGLGNFGSRLLGTRDLLLVPEEFRVRSELERQHIGSELVRGDLNGDGFADLVMGSYENDNVPNDFVFPRVYALFGPLAAESILATQSSASFSLKAPAQDFKAFSSNGALLTGNIGGSAIDDLLVGNALADDGAITDCGAVYGIFGSAGLAGVRDLATTSADFTIFGPAANARLGSETDDDNAGFSLGRLSSDGALDLVARTPTSAYILFGPIPAGTRRLATQPADVIVNGLAGGTLIAMDASGDGRDDLVLASGDDLLLIPGPFSAGQVLDASSAATLRLTGAKARALASADVIGDARRDLLVGSRVERSVFVVAGGATAAGSVPIRELATLVLGGSQTQNFGWDVAAGDLDRDGRSDLLASAWQASDAAAPEFFTDIGRAFVMYGGKAADNCPGVANATQSDGDTDGAGDACDNCLLRANGSQQDLGGIGAGTTHDGVGDTCQCGDLANDGTVEISDAALLRAHLSNPTDLPLSASSLSKCRVAATSAGCNVVQVAVLRRALASLPPGIAPLCAAFTTP